MSEIVATQIEEQPANAVMTPAEMISLAVQNNSSIETITKLMELQDRYDATQAKKAFNISLSAAKAKIPVILKTNKVGYEHKNGQGETNYDHESLSDIATIINPILSAHNLSYRWRTEQGNGGVSVTCIVSHADGYFEENSLHAAPDNSGKKNSIQQVGSTITYLQRYTLKAALGLATGKDDDGQAATETITADQAKDIKGEFEKMGLKPNAFLETLGAPSVDEIPAAAFNAATGLLRVKKEKWRKAQEQSND